MEVDLDFAGIKQYTHARQTVAGEIRSLSEFLKKHFGERKAEECRQLMAKLAEDRFTLAVVGQFKRGKSSLMNAIVGREVLPTGVLPLTSAITVLKYGPGERLTILKDGALYPEEVAVQNLAEYVTEKGNPGNVKKVVRAVLELPVPFLRGGLEFVDTPGIGSSIEANTATTYSFLPNSDAVILVTSVDTPLTQAETDFLQSIREYVRKVFFVVNKIDLAADEEQREEILEFISEKLKRQTGMEEIRVFPVSSAMALNSRLEGKEDEYQRSGLVVLQEALSEFLAHEKSSVFLVSILDKALRLSIDAHNELNLVKRAGQLSKEDALERSATLKENFKSLREARADSMVHMRERIRSWVKERIGADMGSFLATEAEALVRLLDNSLDHSGWKFSLSFVRNFSAQALPHFRQNVLEWTREETEQLNRALLEILQLEWEKIELELGAISRTGAQILGGSSMAAVTGEETTKLPIHWVLAPSGLGDTDWNFPVSLLLGCLPVFLTRKNLRTRLIAGIDDLVGLWSGCIENVFLKGVDEALNRIDLEIERRAGEIESRILQAVKGKKLSKGIDGRWEILDLDLGDLTREIEELKGIQSRLSSIRTGMLEGELMEGGLLPSALETQGDTPGVNASKLPLGYQERGESVEGEFEEAIDSEEDRDLTEDLKTRGCPVCNRMIDAAAHFFANWQYALATQEKAQRTYAASLGFCPLHSWQLEAMASPQGLSQGLPRLMERFSKELATLLGSEDTNAARLILRLVQTPKGCRVCRLVREVEKNYLNGLSAFLQSQEGRNTYRYSQGLCLTHLGALISIVPAKETVRFLVEHAARLFAHTAEDMQNYALKRDALRGYTRNRNEEDAYLRGLIHSVGARRVCFPWELDEDV